MRTYEVLVAAGTNLKPFPHQERYMIKATNLHTVAYRAMKRWRVEHKGRKADEARIVIRHLS